MSEESQLEVESEVTEVVAPITEESADTVAASEETHDKPIFSPEQKAAATSAFKMRESKREAEELRKELDALKNTAQDNAAPVVPVLSEFPEADEVAEYTRKVQEAATFAANQRFSQEQQQNTAYQAQLDEQKRQEDLNQTFVDNSAKQGIKFEDLETAASLVGSYGLKAEIAQAIMADKDGGLTLLHLSTNPQAINDLNAANALTLGTIYSGIKEASSALKPKTSSAPPPAEQLSGNGIPPQSDDIPGVTYT